MRKANNTHVKAINLLMQQTIASYITTFADAEADVTSLQMYADDVAHNVTALQLFNNNKDATSLHTAIIKQDTLVREYFYNVLMYIETNKLVPTYMFACM